MKRFTRLCFVFTAAVLLAGFSSCNFGNNSANNNGNGDDDGDSSETSGSGASGVMLQGFNWNSVNATKDWYVVVKNNASSIKNTFEFVWCPPPSDSGSDNGYLPRQLNKLDSAYGTSSELKSMISSLSPAKAVADIVINHRVGSSNWGTFTNPSFCDDYYAICSDDEGFTTSGSDMYGSSKTGAADTGDGYGSARDLDHTNADVQSGIETWMTDVLKEAGFSGWRYDFVKGYAGNYVGLYNSKTSPSFSVGEYWPTDGYSSSNPSVWGNLLESWCDATEEGGSRSRVFDFTLKGAMNTVFGSNGSGITNSNYKLLADSSNIYISHPEDSVTFVDNHDTGSTQALWYLDPEDLGTAYALILTSPGYPCVAWQHYFTASESCDSSATDQYYASTTVAGTSNTLRQHIDALMSYRTNYGISYDSSRTTLSATSSVYAYKVTGSKGTIVTVIGNGYTPSSTYTELYSGTNFAVYGTTISDAAENSGDDSGDDDGTDDVTEVTLTLNVTSTYKWIWDGDCTIFAYVTSSDGTNQWILCSGAVNDDESAYVNVTVPSDTTELYCIRCPNGTTVDTVESATHWNTSSTVTYVSGTTEYTFTW